MANLPSLLSSAISTTSGAFQVYMAAGWSPVLGLADDGTYYYIQVKDWVGGTGTMPLVGQYLSTSGWTNNIASASRIAIVGGGIPDGDKGDIVVSASGATWTIEARAVTAAKLFAVGANKFLGNHSGSAGDVQEIGLGGGLEFHGGSVRRAALTGDVTASAGSNSTTITPAADPSWITSLALNKLTQSGATTGQIAQWNGTAWVPATASGGAVLKVACTKVTTSGSTTVIIPLDNTTPQNTEGAELMTLSFTPASASSRVIVVASFWYSSHVNTPIAALFLDSDVSAVASTVLNTVPTSNYTQQATAVFDIPSWSGAKTLKLRAGPNFWGGSGAFYWNRLNTGDVLNSTSQMTLTAIEYTP